MTGSPMMELDDPESQVDPLAWVAQHQIDELKARPMPSSGDKRRPCATPFLLAAFAWGLWHTLLHSLGNIRQHLQCASHGVARHPSEAQFHSRPARKCAGKACSHTCCMG